jgi:hypothetical protein
VAEYALIDGYLDTMRTRVRWRRDVEDLVAEMEDHLYSTVERFEARGTDSQLAQRKTLDRFGDPDLMADAFASTPRGGIAVPTKFTKTAGLAALWASGMWVAASLTLWLGFEVLSDESWPFLVFVGFIVGAGAMTLMAAAGLRERHGGFGKLGMAGLIVAGVGVVVTLIVAWAIPFWMTLQGVGYLFVALAVLPMRVAPRMPTIAYGSGLLVGAITWAIARSLEVGSIDEFGDYPLAYVIGGTAGYVILAGGLFGIGLWLRNEEPAPIDSPEDQALTA